jgi:hypothetical protein
MIRYRYLDALDPPAPFVYISLTHPVTAAVLTDVPAQVDSAADRTVLPERLVQTLGLPQVGEIEIGGLGGSTRMIPVYAVPVSVHDRPSRLLAVISCAGEPWVLLGRDELNAHRMTHDGPGLGVEIHPTAPS